MNQRKLVFKVGLWVLIAALFTVGCLKNNQTRLIETKNSITVRTNTNESYEADFIIGEKTFRYHSEIQSGKIKSTLSIFKDKSIIYESLYDYDKTINDYRLLQHKKIEQLAKSLKLDLQSIDLASISSYAKSLLEAIFKSPGFSQKHAQSLFFHIAIINTKLRSLQREDNAYECVPIPEYLLGKSYFWCQEDVLIKVDLVKGVFRDNPYLMEDAKAKKLFDYITATNMDYLSYDKISVVSRLN